MLLHVFNPEHDLALAAGLAPYTPPASARQMAADLQLLPRLWAAPGDVILLADGGLVRVAENDADAGGPVDASVLAEVSGVMPWGWDASVVRRLRQAGVPPALLPAEAWLSAFRAATGRATAMRVLTTLKTSPLLAPWQGAIVGQATRCDSTDAARAAYPGYMIFKQPWSGSGRGLRPSAPPHTDPQTEAWLRRTLRTQGYVMAEPLYNKVQDVAAELWRQPDGSVTFQGLSVFSTTAGGVYDGNLVAAETEKRRRLAELIDLDVLDAAIRALTVTLEAEMAHLDRQMPATADAGWTAAYSGPIGVDMMIVEGRRLHPCVEINFRMTMGFVALALAQRRLELHGTLFNIRCRNGRYVAGNFPPDIFAEHLWEVDV